VKIIQIDLSRTLFSDIYIYIYNFPIKIFRGKRSKLWTYYNMKPEGVCAGGKHKTPPESGNMQR
jgi:hypothetical protein